MLTVKNDIPCQSVIARIMALKTHVANYLNPLQQI